MCLLLHAHTNQLRFFLSFQSAHKTYSHLQLDRLSIVLADLVPGLAVPVHGENTGWNGCELVYVQTNDNDKEIRTTTNIKTNRNRYSAAHATSPEAQATQNT